MIASINTREYKEAMKVAGLTQKDLAPLLGYRYDMSITYKGLGALVQGRSTWKLCYALAISDILGVSVETLFKLKKK